MHFASNYHGNEITSASRTMNDGSKLTTNCSLVVKDYNMFMGGVNLTDRYRSLQYTVLIGNQINGG